MAEGQNNGNNVPSTTLTLTVAWDQLTGQLSVTGQLVNKVVCYGMLDLAKETIGEFFERQKSSLVLPGGVQVTTRQIS